MGLGAVAANLILYGERAVISEGAISSAGERFVHTEEVTGSIPVSPTSNNSTSVAYPGRSLELGQVDQRCSKWVIGLGSRPETGNLPGAGRPLPEGDPSDPL